MWGQPDSNGSHNGAPNGGHGWGRHYAKWVALAIVLMIAWNASNWTLWRAGTVVPFLTAFFGAILVVRLIRALRERADRNQTWAIPLEKEKRKRDGDSSSYDFDFEADQPVARAPRIGVGEDGEMIELPPEYTEDDPPKRKRDGGIDYV